MYSPIAPRQELAALTGQLATRLIETGDNRYVRSGKRMLECYRPLPDSLPGMESWNRRCGQTSLCPTCRQWKAAQEGWGAFHRIQAQTVQADGRLAPHLATFTLKDSTTSQLGTSFEHLTGSLGRLRRRKGFADSCVGWFRTIEVTPSGIDSDLENLHAHAVLLIDNDQEPSADHWDSLWWDCAGTEARSAEVKLIDLTGLENVCHYVVKSTVQNALDQSKADLQDLSRFLARHERLGGERRMEYGGCLYGDSGRVTARSRRCGVN